VLGFPSKAFAAFCPLPQTLNEVAGHVDPLHDLIKLIGAVDLLAAAFPTNPGEHLQSDIKKEPSRE
jgi:hypothetical protein